MFEEWKNSRITATTNGSLPSPAACSANIQLVESYHVVEVLKYSNISVSSHSQLRKFNENDDFDGEDQGHGGGSFNQPKGGLKNRK